MAVEVYEKQGMFLGFEKRFNKQMEGAAEDANAFRMAGRLKTGKGVILDFTAFPDNKQLVELEEKEGAIVILKLYDKVKLDQTYINLSKFEGAVKVVQNAIQI